jgi:hypothetical protein
MKLVEIVLRRGKRGRRRMMERVNPTKIYFKYIKFTVYPPVVIC